MKAIYLLVPFVLAFGTGCGKKKGGNGGAKPAASAAADVNWGNLTQIPTVTAVIIRPEVGNACNFSKGQRIFPYDSATIGGDGQNHLNALAACMKDGGLKGKDIKVLAHDTPNQGEPDGYRELTGQSRAEAVAKVLINAGVGNTRVNAISVGERSVSEEGPSDWPVERREDLLLAD